MTPRYRLTAFALGLTVAWTFPGFSVAADSYPTRPASHVLDQTQVLDDRGISALHALLAEHERLTGEQIYIAIVNGETAELGSYSRGLFLAWEIGRASRGSGLLIAAAPATRQGAIQVGYGLEGVLGAEADRITAEVLLPSLKKGRAGEAISNTVAEVLRVLESPLVSSPQAASAIYALSRSTRGSDGTNGGAPLWWLLLVLGLVVGGGITTLVVSHEAHYTGSGWFRPRPWQLIRIAIGKGRAGERSQVEGATGGW